MIKFSDIHVGCVIHCPNRFEIIVTKINKDIGGVWWKYFSTYPCSIHNTDINLDKPVGPYIITSDVGFKSMYIKHTRKYNLLEEV